VGRRGELKQYAQARLVRPRAQTAGGAQGANLTNTAEIGMRHWGNYRTSEMITGPFLFVRRAAWSPRAISPWHSKALRS